MFIHQEEGFEPDVQLHFRLQLRLRLHGANQRWVRCKLWTIQLQGDRLACHLLKQLVQTCFWQSTRIRVRRFIQHTLPFGGTDYLLPLTIDQKFVQKKKTIDQRNEYLSSLRHEYQLGLKWGGSNPKQVTLGFKPPHSTPFHPVLDKTELTRLVWFHSRILAHDSQEKNLTYMEY